MAVRSAAARLISSWSLYASSTRRWWAGSVVLNGSGDVSRAFGPGFLFCFSASMMLFRCKLIARLRHDGSQVVI